MPCADVMALFQEVQRQRGYELLDAISVSSIAEMDKRGQKAVLDRARKLTAWSWEPPPSVYESMPDAERIVALGNCYSVGGREWATSHPGQVAWLTERGVSLEGAARRYREWMTDRMAMLGETVSTPLGGVQRRRRKQ